MGGWSYILLLAASFLGEGLEVYLCLTASFCGAGLDAYTSLIADLIVVLFKALYVCIVHLFDADLDKYDSLSDS